MRARHAIALSLAMAAMTRHEESAAAPSRSDVEEAKLYFDAGAQAFSVGQFAVATQAFDRAYSLAPRPGLLFSMGQSERRQWVVDRNTEHLRRAIDAFRGYLKEDENGRRRAEAVEALTELEPLLGRATTEGPAAGGTAPATRLMVTARAGSSVTVDDGPPADAPFIDRATPGRHAVRVTAAGFVPELREVVVDPGALVVVDVTLRERPGVLRVIGPRGATVWVDGQARTEGATSALVLAHGKHAIAVTAPGHEPWESVVDVERGREKTIHASLVTSRQRRAAYVAFAAGGTAFVAAGALGVVSLVHQGNARAFLSDRERGNVTGAAIDDYDSETRQRNGWRTASFLSMGVGAAILGGGAALYLFDKPVARRWTPEITARGVGVRLRF